jgi:hypothetical protein
MNFLQLASDHASVEGTSIVLCVVYALLAALGAGALAYGIGLAAKADARRWGLIAAAVVGGIVLLLCAL